MTGASYESEHLGDVHGVARPCVREQFGELRPLKWVEAAGGAGVLFEDDRVLDPGLGEDEVLTVGRLFVGRHPLVDEIGHALPRFCRRIGPRLSSNPVVNVHRISLDPSRRQVPEFRGSLDVRHTCRHSIVCRQTTAAGPWTGSVRLSLTGGLPTLSLLDEIGLGASVQPLALRYVMD